MLPNVLTTTEESLCINEVTIVEKEIGDEGHAAEHIFLLLEKRQVFQMSTNHVEHKIQKEP